MRYLLAATIMFLSLVIILVVSIMAVIATHNGGPIVMEVITLAGALALGLVAAGLVDAEESK